jgi:hypothetical protein
MIKTDIHILLLVLAKMGYHTQGLMLNECIKTNYVRFSEKLIKKFSQMIKDEIVEDDFNPLQVKNSDELGKNTCDIIS